MMKYLQLTIIVVTAVLMSSCATILTGTTQRLTIDSTPQGAEIIIDGRIMGNTPSRVRLDRDLNAFIDDGKPIELHMDGFYHDGYILGTDIEPTCVLNVFMPVGFALDAITGAIMKYDSDYYNFRLIPLDNMQPKYPSTPPGPVTPAKDSSVEEDNYEKLMNLVELYEKGLISEEEFETEKAKIFKKNRE
ncbi:MAG TPA: SHOCT domain-containing protein [Bacteroidales bacterium]|nr:SHOCT domain-containing protein [Bacteroidales bacterium]